MPDYEQIVRGVFARWNNGDFEPLEEETDPDIEVVTRTAQFQGEPFHGVEGVRRWIAETLESFDEWDLRLDELETLDDRVLAVGAVHFRGRDSGVVLDAPCAWLFDFRDGRCVRFESFINEVDEARAAARTRHT